MNKSNTVVIGMSGGVDSSVAAVELLKEGYGVIGVTLKLFDANQSAAEDARKVADKLGIPHHVLDFRPQFKKHVADYFVSEYQNGRTPNPCVVCNRHVKFESLLQKVHDLGAEYIATGHYAKTEINESGRYVLKCADDELKDQTYFLYALNQHQLAHVKFPLSNFTKLETRKIAEELGLSVADKADSQEICFIPDNNYTDYIKQNIKIPPKAGSFLDTDGNIIGDHKGIINYTIGQRKGLGAFGKRVFVTKINSNENTVTLGEDSELFGDYLTATNLNFIPFDFKNFTGELTAQAKIRYSAPPAECTITKLDNNRVSVKFHKPLRAITPGQAVVFYQDDIVLGGGTIE